MRKIVKYLIIFWISFIVLCIAMGASRLVTLNHPKIKGPSKEIITFLSTLCLNVINFSEFIKPIVITNSFPLENGFNYKAKYQTSNDYLLITVWNDSIGQSIVKLIRIRDGKVLHRWAPDVKPLNKSFNSGFSYGYKNSLTKNTTRLKHPILNNDGSLVFSSGGIYKIDKFSNLIWSNNTSSHHSIEPDSEGNYWICSYNSETLNSEKYKIMDDAIKKISQKDGKILFEKSVYEILMENGYGRGQFFINPQAYANLSYIDYIHLNDIQPVITDSRFWKKDDLFLSLRNQNLILQYRPSTNKIIWSQKGPWINQHDVDIIDSCRIGIFGNNVINGKFPNRKQQLIDGHNTQYIYDFSKNSTTTPYDAFFESANIGTYTAGLSRILENGDIFVEETNHGRIIYGNFTEETWSYIEQIDKTHISMLGWSRYITEDEFRDLTFLNQTH